MDSDVRLRCSAWAQEVDLSPSGTCGSYRGYLLLERPLPWPNDIAGVPALAGLARNPVMAQKPYRRSPFRAYVSAPPAGDVMGLRRRPPGPASRGALSDLRRSGRALSRLPRPARTSRSGSRTRGALSGRLGTTR